MRILRGSKLLPFLSIVLLFSVIFFVFIKVSKLENAKKEMNAVAGGVVKTSAKTLEKVQGKDYVLGSKDAPVTLIEYSDFECPQCQELHPTLMSLLSNYKGKVKLITRMFPLPQNINAEKEAEAAECAGSIGGNDIFWKYGNTIFKRTTGAEGGEGFPLNKLIPLAKELGINGQQFTDCLNSGRFASRIVSEKQSGEDAGVNALPALFVIDTKGHTLFLTGNQSYAVLQAVVDEALAQF